MPIKKNDSNKQNKYKIKFKLKWEKFGKLQGSVVECKLVIVLET